MLNKRIRIAALLLGLGVLGFCAIVLWWPKNDKLPILGSIHDYYFEDAFHGSYRLANDKVKITMFFYTRCPDICPLTLHDFSDLQAELKKADLFGKQVELVSITFDPEHDTPKVLRQYAARFQADPKGWKWLSGSPTAIRQLADELRVQFKKIDKHFYSHSTTMFLIDKNNRVRAIYDMAFQRKPIEKQKILDDVTYLVNH